MFIIIKQTLKIRNFKFLTFICCFYKILFKILSLLILNCYDEIENFVCKISSSFASNFPDNLSFFNVLLIQKG